MYFSIFISILFSLIFVLSIYIWKNDENRNTTNSIKKRTISVLLACLICFIICYFILEKEILFLSFGFNFSFFSNFFGILNSFILISLLFFGPLIQISLDNSFINLKKKNLNFKILFNFFLNFFKEIKKFFFSFSNLSNSDYQTIRNLIIGPFAEEFVFRSCICSILILNFNQNQSILISSFLFGISHTHHVIELLYHQNRSLKSAILIVSIQCKYYFILIFHPFSSITLL